MTVHRALLSPSPLAFLALLCVFAVASSGSAAIGAFRVIRVLFQGVSTRKGDPIGTALKSKV